VIVRNFRVRELVLRYIDSVAELEALLLLRAEEGPWRHETLAPRLYVDDRTADQVLMALHRGGLVSRADDGFRYAPRSDALRRAVGELADSYPKFLIPMTHLIHSKSRSALRDFAGAFTLRRGSGAAQ
jgi:hypothetical protein